MLCATLWEGQGFVRVIVEEVLDDDALVRQVDHGGADLVSGSDLFHLPGPMFAAAPPFALRCALQDLPTRNPISPEAFQSLWNESEVYLNAAVQPSEPQGQWRVQLIVARDMRNLLVSQNEEDQDPDSDSEGCSSPAPKNCFVQDWVDNASSVSTLPPSSLASSVPSKLVSSDILPPAPSLPSTFSTWMETPLQEIDPIPLIPYLNDELPILPLFTAMDAHYCAPQNTSPPLDPDQITMGSLLAVNTGHGNWYRGEVTGWDAAAARVRVLLFDLGTEESVEVRNTRALDMSFCVLARAAAKFRLKGLSGAGKEEKHKKLTRAKELLTRALETQDFLTCLLCEETSAEIPTVDLYLDEACTRTLSEALLSEKEGEGSPVASEDGSLVGSDEGLPEEWNPIEEDFFKTNNPANLLKEISTESKGPRICRFYRETRVCQRGKACPDQHIFMGLGSAGLDYEVNMVAYNETQPLEENCLVRCQVTLVRNPGKFFITLPWGRIDLNTSDIGTIEAGERALQMEENLESLHGAMTAFYSSGINRQKYNKNVTGTGEIVAALFERDQLWMRARVIKKGEDDAGEDGLVVFFVDFGITDSVETVCRIDPKFLQLPFQALECRLSGVNPAFSKSAGSFSPWPKEATVRFHSLTQGKHMVARVIRVSDNGEHEVDLTDQEHQNIREVLIDEKLAVKATDHKNLNAANRKLLRGGCIMLPG